MTQGPRPHPTLRPILFLAAACALSVAAYGCAATSASLTAPLSEADATAAHDGLRALQKTMTDALNARDVDAIIAGLHPQIVFSPMNGKLFEGHQAVRDYLNQTLGGPTALIKSLTVEMVPANLSILYGDSVAVAYGSSTDTYTLITGQSFTAHTRWTATIIKADGAWKIAAFQNGLDDRTFDRVISGMLSGSP